MALGDGEGPAVRQGRDHLERVGGEDGKLPKVGWRASARRHDPERAAFQGFAIPVRVSGRGGAGVEWRQGRQEGHALGVVREGAHQIRMRGRRGLFEGGRDVGDGLRGRQSVDGGRAQGKGRIGEDPEQAGHRRHMEQQKQADAAAQAHAPIQHRTTLGPNR